MADLIKIQKNINNIIDSELNAIAWDNKYTVPCKTCALQSIKNILNRYPIDMSRYLIFNSRAGGFQNKLFHEFVKLMEDKLPFFIEKNKETHLINSIQDPILNIFCGKTTFEGVVYDNIIKNNTKEIYIGGRKSYYIKPYYMGKILSIKDEYNNDLIKKIKSYSFEKIITKQLNDNLKVEVTHLMTFPHYQMGALLYINRARKIIINKYNINYLFINN